MEYLGQLNGHRLFTYKVAHDGGSAPNPYHGICTLALCKPAIRAVAEAGDVVVGFGCGAEANRIVYCMQVEASLPWEEYIRACRGDPGSIYSGPSFAGLRKKVPVGPHDPGDCIWPKAHGYEEALDSWSGHGGPEDYERDVAGKRVLIAHTFWYFGKVEVIRLRPELQVIVPNRGHRSNANGRYADEFVKFFNSELERLRIAGPGMLGTPALEPEKVDKQTCSRSRAEEKISDAEPEEV